MDIQALSEPLYRAKFWMQLVGVMMIIYGVALVITLIGILIAWLPIWMGVMLFQSAGQIEKAHMSNDEQAMLTSLAKLKTYFTITGVLTLIGLIVGLVGFLLGLGSLTTLSGQTF